MTSCSMVAEGFLNQTGESKKQEKQPLKQRCCQPHKNGKRMKGSCNRNHLEQVAAPPLQYLPAGIQASQGFWQTDWWEHGLRDHCQILRSCKCIQKDPCLLENRQSLAQLLTCRLPLAQPQRSAGTGSQQRRNWAAIHVYCLCLFWSQGWFCLKLQKSAILPVWHTGNPLPLNHSVNMYSLAECYPYAVWCFTAQKALLNPRGDWQYK